jgi:radical SAM-linked protein
MLRALFEKTGDAIYISHLDLMRVFQRAFARADLRLTHSQGYNPRPSVSIAMPLSVGVTSRCELLDFELDGCSASCEDIRDKLNAALVDGIHVMGVYENGSKLKNLSLLDCTVTLEYDSGVSVDAQRNIEELFARPELIVEKKGKNGTTDQDLIPMIRKIGVNKLDEKTLVLQALVCCQNPSLNPMQLSAAIEGYLPDLTPNFSKCRRVEVFDSNKQIFR